MSQGKIALINVHERLAPSVEDVKRRLDEAWTHATPLQLEPIDPSDLHEETIGDYDAVIFIDDGDDAPTNLFSLLSAFEEHSIPVIALTGSDLTSGHPFEFAEVIVRPLSLDDHQLCSLLDGVIYRQQEVSRLQTEVQLAQRLQGGLRDQISKMHEEMQLAAMVQRDFLPTEIPSLCGVSFDVLWRPAHYVSGDIYDVIRLDEDHIGVFLADAAGHGVPAALMTMIIHRSLMTKELEDNTLRVLSPSEVMKRLNNGLIHRQGAHGRFATAVYAVVNCRTRIMTLAGAGHPPPKLIHADGTTSHIETTGSLLGVFENEEFEQVEIELQADDCMMLYSDGFEQAFPNDAQDSHKRKLPTEQYHLEFDEIGKLNDPEAMINAIKERLNEQMGSLHQIDDLTLICMHAGALQNIDQAFEDTQGEQFSITI